MFEWPQNWTDGPDRSNSLYFSFYGVPKHFSLSVASEAVDIRIIVTDKYLRGRPHSHGLVIHLAKLVDVGQLVISDQGLKLLFFFPVLRETCMYPLHYEPKTQPKWNFLWKNQIESIYFYLTSISINFYYEPIIL